MKIDSRFKIEQIVAGVDDERGILKHVKIDLWHDEPVAVAADGFCMAVVPVTMDPSDKFGLVHHGVWDIIRHEQGQNWDLEIDLEDAERVEFRNRHTAPRTVGDVGNYPEWQKIVPEKGLGGQPHESFGIQPKLLYRLSMALGEQYVNVYHCSESRVVISGSPQERVLKPPFGIQMLVHMVG